MGTTLLLLLAALASAPTLGTPGTTASKHGHKQARRALDPDGDAAGVKRPSVVQHAALGSSLPAGTANYYHVSHVSGAVEGSGPWALLLPLDPAASARALWGAFGEASVVRVGVVATDSLGRPFRLGSVGYAVGVAGLPALSDQRSGADLDGCPLEHTVTGNRLAAVGEAT